VAAAACDALRTRQGAAKAALIDRYLLCDDEKFGSRTLGKNPSACIRVLAFLGLDFVMAG
jgi:hypothetical protein